MKLMTEIQLRRSKVQLSGDSRIMTLGSCFSDNMAGHLRDAGFTMLANPFGTLYNPESIASAIERLDSGRPFTESDCAEMGAGAGLVCSFEHHTSFARKTPGEFLDHANSSLERSRIFWKDCDRVIVTYGTARVWRRNGRTVSNCLKRDAKEFTRQRLDLQSEVDILAGMVRKASSGGISRQFIFTVSPIRHLKDGAHGNLISKATLLLAEEEICGMFPGQCEYFPAYEIMMDELRDYRFYAEDMIHPSAQAVNYIWERFCDFALADSERPVLAEKEREFRRSQHVEGRRWSSL